MEGATKQLLGILAICALSTGLTVCGGTGPTGTTSAISASVPAYYSKHNNDRDNDGDHNSDDAKIVDYGHAASATDRHDATALAKRYLAAAAAANGAAGCALLAPYVAETLSEEDGFHPQTSGSTCRVVLGKIFALHHQELAGKQASMRVSVVRVQGNRGLLVLEFPSIPETRQMLIHRLAVGWRLMQPLDSILE